MLECFLHEEKRRRKVPNMGLRGPISICPHAQVRACQLAQQCTQIHQNTSGRRMTQVPWLRGAVATGVSGALCCLMLPYAAFYAPLLAALRAAACKSLLSVTFHPFQHRRRDA